MIGALSASLLDREIRGATYDTSGDSNQAA
jgi:hypothetical protein